MSGVNNAKNYYTLMNFGRQDPETGAPIIYNSLLQGGIVSVYYLGTLVGALGGGSFGDRYGRIKAIGLGAAWAVIGASLQCSAQGHNWMIGARFVNGIGTGILNAIVPVYATETAEHTSRGQFVAIEFTLNIFGVVVAYWLEVSSFGLHLLGRLLSRRNSTLARSSVTDHRRSSGGSRSGFRSFRSSSYSPGVGRSPNRRDTWSKLASTRRHDTFWADYVANKVRTKAKPMPSTKTSATRSSSKGRRARLSRTGRCCLEWAAGGFTPADECNSWSGSRLCKSGSVSPVSPSSRPPSSASPGFATRTHSGSLDSTPSLTCCPP